MASSEAGAVGARKGVLWGETTTCLVCGSGFLYYKLHTSYTKNRVGMVQGSSFEGGHPRARLQTEDTHTHGRRRASGEVGREFETRSYAVTRGIERAYFIGPDFHGP